MKEGRKNRRKEGSKTASNTGARRLKVVGFRLNLKVKKGLGGSSVIVDNSRNDLVDSRAGFV